MCSAENTVTFTVNSFVAIDKMPLTVGLGFYGAIYNIPSKYLIAYVHCSVAHALCFRLLVEVSSNYLFKKNLAIS